MRREPDGGIWAAVRPSVASSTAPRRGSDVLLTTLDHPGAGVARDGGGEQREYAYYVFQDSCMRAICKEPLHVQTQNGAGLQSAVLQRTAAQRDRWRAEIVIDGVPDHVYL